MEEKTIIILPTNDKSLIHWNEDNHYFMTKRPTNIGTNYHLYITSDGKMEKDEIVIYGKSLFLIEHIFTKVNGDVNKVEICGKFISEYISGWEYCEFNSFTPLNKIISTTNNGLNEKLNNISKKFINGVICELNKGNLYLNQLTKKSTLKLLNSKK